MRGQVSRRGAALTIACATLAATALGCGGSSESGGSTEDRSIEVLMVNNPQMRDLQKLTAEHFTRETGIEVHFTVLPENDVRDKIGDEFSRQSGRYDVATISNFEVPIYAENEWLQPLDAFVQKDPSFDQHDILDSVEQSLTAGDGKLYAEPFYGESSFLMYRKDVFDKKNLTMPKAPTWQQVAELADRADEAEPQMAGICLRGSPGWGEMIAPLTTVVNTFGGTWFTKDWQARLDAPEFVEATEFYVDLVRNHGDPAAQQAGYAECLNNFLNNRAAMWYDATAAAGPLEAAGSKVRGKVGYVPAPRGKTEHSGWLYTWAWGIQKASEKHGAAWEFVSWASGREYEELVGKEFGWANVPAGKRSSTFDNPDYQRAAKAFHPIVRDSIADVDPDNPGVQPRPAVGIQFVGIPEFTTLGTRVSQELSDAIAGRQTVKKALERSQEMADEVAAEYRKKAAKE